MENLFGAAEKLVSTMTTRREFDMLEVKFKEMKAAVHSKKLKLDCGATTAALAAITGEHAPALHKLFDQLVLLKCRHRQHSDGTDEIRDTLAVFAVGTGSLVNIKLQIREKLEFKGDYMGKSFSMYSLSWCKSRSYPYNSYRVSQGEDLWRISPDGKETNVFDVNQAEALLCKLKMESVEPRDFVFHLSKMILDIITQEGHLKNFRLDDDVSTLLLGELILPSLSKNRKQAKQRKYESESSEEEDLRVREHKEVFKRMRGMNVTSPVVRPAD